MTIRRITDAEVDAASVARLATRPNESGGYGKHALTASELKNAFDALGKLCVSRYNELVDGLSDGSAASFLMLDGVPLSEAVSEKADKEETDTRIVALDEAQRSFAADTSTAVESLESAVGVLTEEMSGVKAVAEENRVALSQKTDNESFYGATAVAGGELVPVRLNTAYAGSFPASLSGERFFIPAGTKLSKGNKPTILLGEFDVAAGETYFVYTDERLPGIYCADDGSDMYTHVRDGMRLHVTIDADGGGNEDKLYKLTNFGHTEDRIRYTSEPIVFTAEKSGVASITLSMCNTTNDLRFPFYDADTYVTPRVSRHSPDASLFLDTEMRPAWKEKKEGVDKDGLLYTLPISEDSIDPMSMPCPIEGNTISICWPGGEKAIIEINGEGARILKGSRLSNGCCFWIRLGAFDAVKGRSYFVRTRDSHLYGGNDGYILGVTRRDRVYTSPLYENEMTPGFHPASDMADGFVFTAEESGRHIVKILVYTDSEVIPPDFLEDVTIRAYVRDVTPTATECRSGSETISEETLLFDVSSFAEGKPLVEAEEVMLKLYNVGAGDTLSLSVYDGNGEEYCESVSLSASTELFSLDLKPWLWRHVSATESKSTESVSLYAFGRNSYPSTGLRRMTCRFTPAAEKGIRHELYVR